MVHNLLAYLNKLLFDDCAASKLARLAAYKDDGFLADEYPGPAVVVAADARRVFRGAVEEVSHSVLTGNRRISLTACSQK